MNQDMEDFFSMRGAYVDDDGIDIGSNDVAPRSPRVPPAVQLGAFDWRWLSWSIAIGAALAVAIIARSLR